MGFLRCLTLVERDLPEPRRRRQRERRPTKRGDLALDGQLYRRIAGDILRLEPDAVGLTALGCNFICTAKVASHLKAARPDMPVLLVTAPRQACQTCRAYPGNRSLPSPG